MPGGAKWRELQEKTEGTPEGSGGCS